MFLNATKLSYKWVKWMVMNVVSSVKQFRHPASRAWQSMAAPRSFPVPASMPAPVLPVESTLDESNTTFHTRTGDGFKVVFSLRLDTHTIQPVVWLDFKRLKERLGEDAAEDMQTRLGQLPSYVLHEGRRPYWGRLALPEVPLQVRSSREMRARTFMLDTLDVIDHMIAEGGRDLVSGRWERLPQGVETVTVQQSLPLKEEGLPAREPKKPRADVVCIGNLLGTGLAERKDAASGRTYQVFYADIDLGGGRSCRQTGADLERALRDAEVKVGDRVRLEQCGTVPVNGGRFRKKVWTAEVLLI